MGQEIATDEFSPESFNAFARHLDSEMQLLQSWFEGGKFCADELQVGLELEGWLIGPDGVPVPDNRLFLSTLSRRSVVPELSKFNFEINVTPQYLRGCGLRDMSLELNTTWARCRQVATKLDHRILSIGILPTVTDAMLCVENMSPFKRYAAINKQVLKMRGGSPLRLQIEGIDRLETEHRDVMLESAATSVQVHLKVPAHQAVRFYNASVIASAFTVAMAANAPLLFGKRLWDDTRITVFEQAVDTATDPRVWFGDRYVESSLWEIFRMNHAQPVLLPAELEQPPAMMPYVRMHNGTLWNWNRPLIGFEADGQPHLRIEHRPMSASPTISDLMADVVLYLGLTCHLATLESPPESELPFKVAHENFYRAARGSLDAEICWFDGRLAPLHQVLEAELLSPAMVALQQTGVREDEIRAAEQILQARLETKQNGAAWQRRKYAEYDNDARRLLLEYERNQVQGEPVHTWS